MGARRVCASNRGWWRRSRHGRFIIIAVRHGLYLIVARRMVLLLEDELSKQMCAAGGLCGGCQHEPVGVVAVRHNCDDGCTRLLAAWMGTGGTFHAFDTTTALKSFDSETHRKGRGPSDVHALMYTCRSAVCSEGMSTCTVRSKFPPYTTP